MTSGAGHEMREKLDATNNISLSAAAVPTGVAHRDVAPVN
jgi:hypothetical protein